MSQRIRAAGAGCEREGKTAAGTADRDDGSHRHPGQRSEVYNSGGGPAEQSGDRAERKDPHDSDSGSAEKEAAAVCGRKGDFFRRNFYHEERKRDFPPADLGGDETVVSVGGDSENEGISA